MRHVVWRMLPIVLGGAFLLIALLSSPPVMVGATPPLNITETSTAEPPTRTPTTEPTSTPTNTPTTEPTSTPTNTPTNTPVVPPTRTPVIPPTDTPTPAVPPDSPGARPDLVLNKSVSPTMAQVGDQVVYTLTISNTGSAPAVDVTIDDPLPAFLRLIDASTSSGAVQIAGNRVTVVVPVVVPGEVVTITIRAEVVTEPLPPDNSNVAVARSSTTEITTDNNTSSTTLLPPLPDLRISKTVFPMVVQVGDSVVYTLMVENVGNAPAADVVLTDVLPPSLELFKVTTDGSVSTNGNQVTVTAPSLAPGQTMVVLIAAQVVAPPVAPNNVNTASVRTSDREITTDNNTSSATIDSPPSSLPQTAGNPVRPFLSLIGLALVIIGLGALLQRRSYR